MDPFLLILIPILAGFLLMGFGFHNREREWGVRVLAVGALLTLIPIGVGIYLAIH